MLRAESYKNRLMFHNVVKKIKGVLMISFSLFMQQTQEVTHTNCLSREVSIIFEKTFFGWTHC